MNTINKSVTPSKEERQGPTQNFSIEIPAEKIQEVVRAIARIKLDGDTSSFQSDAKGIIDSINFNKGLVEACLRPNLIIDEIAPRLLSFRKQLIRKYGKEGSIHTLVKNTEDEFLESNWVRNSMWFYIVKYLQEQLSHQLNKLELAVVMLRIAESVEYKPATNSSIYETSVAERLIADLKAELSDKYDEQQMDAMVAEHDGFDLYYDLFNKMLNPDYPSSEKKFIREKFINAICAFITIEIPHEKRPFVFKLTGLLAADIGLLLTEEQYNPALKTSYEDYLLEHVTVAINRSTRKILQKTKAIS